MAKKSLSKLDALLAQLPDGMIVTHQWLRVMGYPRPLVESYVAAGQLDSPAHGVFARPGSKITWMSVVGSLQFALGYDVHVGGRTALAIDGHAPRPVTTVTLIGGGAQATLAETMGLPERFEFLRGRRLGLQSMRAAGTETLEERGLTVRKADDGTGADFVASVPERAMVELLVYTAGESDVLDADASMATMVNARPDVVTGLLARSVSAQAKRLYFALAERHGHPWIKDVDREQIDFGSAAVRDVTPGGWMHPVWRVTLPRRMAPSVW